MLLSVSLTGRDRDLEKESTRLVDLFKYAREQAELQTREYGVMFQDDGYEFLVYDIHRGLWREVFEDDALSERQLPDGLDFKLSVDARPGGAQAPQGCHRQDPAGHAVLLRRAEHLQRDPRARQRRAHGGHRPERQGRDRAGRMVERKP